MTETKNPKSGIAARAEALVLPTANEQGLTIWDVTFGRRGADRYLTFTVDKAEGVTIEDCEKFHRAIDPLLDEADWIEGSYMLEVSSPGIERELTRPEHFEYALGRKVSAKLYAPQDGQKTITGVLSAYEKDTLTLTDNGKETVLPRPNVAKLTTVYDFENET